MYTRSEGFFTGYHDAKLYYQKWAPPESKGHLIITHGHGEHSDCYQRVVNALAEEAWTIYAWDWRGHGRSDGLRGYANNFNEYCYDFEVFLKLLLNRPDFSGKPAALLAHSMGGLIQLKTLLSHPELKFSAQVLSSPLLGVQVAVPAYKQTAAELLKNFLPKITLASGIIPAYLSRDPLILKEYDKDVLAHDRISSGVYLGSLEAIKFVQERADRFTIPTLMQIADKDQVVSTEENKKLFGKLTCKKTLKEYVGHKHELYNDLDRDLVFADLKTFLRKHQK